MRAHRLQVASQVARRRLLSLPRDMRDQVIGRFRKWNLTCTCSYCTAMRGVKNNLQKLKDYRRNG